MNALLKLIQPVSGKIIIGDGLENDEIGYMPQQTAAQKDFPASVWEVVLSGGLNRMGFRPFYSKADKITANENMQKLGITDIKKRCFRELSGGQQQRVLLARALCSTRKILLLDEPVAGLDPGASNDMYNLIHEINHEGTTIVMISHDIAASIKYASHILHVGQQSILFFGTTIDYMKSEIGKIYAGSGNHENSPDGEGGES